MGEASGRGLPGFHLRELSHRIIQGSGRRGETFFRRMRKMGKYFGTDGFRGEANVDLTVEHAYKVGRYLGW